MNSLISIQDVSFGYNNTPVLTNVSLAIEHLDFVGVIGPNGGGKTTFLKLILGVIHPDIGTISYRDDLTPDRVGYLSQNKVIDHTFPINCLDVVLSGYFAKKRIRRRITKAEKSNALALLSLCGVADLAKKPIGETSGGERQRVLLCRALVSDPLLLILDEPESFLDAKFEKELYALLKELNKKITIIVVSHDTGMISSYVKTVICVNKKVVMHPSTEISNETLENYGCPVELVTHGKIPHRVLHEH